jgi:hypothetical protein
MANTYTLIASNTVGSGGAASINFTSIPATYTDLVIQYSIRISQAGTNDWALLTFNSIGGTSNNAIYLRGDGSTAASSSGLTSNYIRGVIANGASSTASTFASNTVYIPNYTSSNYKSVSLDGTQEDNATANYMVITAGLLTNTSVITSIQLAAPSGTFVQYSTAYLYGISNS